MSQTATDKQMSRYLKRAWSSTDDVMVALNRLLALAKETGSPAATRAVFHLIDKTAATGGIPEDVASAMARSMLLQVLVSMGIPHESEQKIIRARRPDGSPGRTEIGWAGDGWFRRRGKAVVELPDSAEAATQLIHEASGGWS